MFPFAAPQLPSVVSAPFAGILDGVLSGVLNGEPGTDTWVSDIDKDVVDAVVAPSEDNDDDGDGDGGKDGDADGGFGNGDDDGALIVDGVLRELGIASKEELVVAVPELEGLELIELAIVFIKLVGKIEIELLLPITEGILIAVVVSWNEEPDPKELTIEGVITLDGVLIAFEVLDKDKPAVDETEVELLETDGLTNELMGLVAEVEIELPLLTIEGGMGDKIVDWDEGVEPEAPVLWADATFVDKDRPLLERADEEEVKGAS